MRLKQLRLEVLEANLELVRRGLVAEGNLAHQVGVEMRHPFHDRAMVEVMLAAPAHLT